MKSQPVIAIVGRPNVGKSALMNRIVGRRHAIVVSTPGVTRDRNYAPGNWNGREFMVVNTGGLDPSNDTHIQEEINLQVDFALSEADSIIFLCDFLDGLLPHDLEILHLLRKKCSQKPLFVVINKIDNAGRSDEMYDFYELGVEKLFPISALHGHGVADLLDEVVAPFPIPEKEREGTDELGMIAIVGRPNVGKSSLLNRILGERRSIVDEVPGTTRDTIHVTITRNGKEYHFIDTAGLRRPSRRKDAIETFSVLRTLSTIKRSDIAVLLLDATQPEITEQDKRIAGQIIDANAACVIAWNKWDIADKTLKPWDEMVRMTRDAFPLLEFAPLTSISALTGMRVDRLFDLIDQVREAGRTQIPKKRLSEILFDTITIQPPATYKGRAMIIDELVQLPGPGVTFKVRCSEPLGLHFSYQRYILNQIRQEFPFPGWPVKLSVGKRGRK